MLDFIGLPWDPKCLDFHQTDRVVITSSKWQVRQKIHSASAGRWRNYEKFMGPLRRLVGSQLRGVNRDHRIGVAAIVNIIFGADRHS